GEEPWESGAEEGLAGSVPSKVAAFVESIRTKNLQDEVAGGVDSTLTAILGRTAAYESEGRFWEKVAGSKERWPKIDLAWLASPSRARGRSIGGRSWRRRRGRPPPPSP